MQRWYDRTLAATVVLLVASVSLLVPGLAGLGGSGPMLAVLLSAGAVLAAFRPKLAELPSVLGYDLAVYLRESWLGPVVAVGLVLVIQPGASPAEMQAIGGIAGFVGMLNYFVRPLYFLVFGAVRRVLPIDRSA